MGKKLKKTFSSPDPLPSPMENDNEDLMDDLLAQLDSKDKVVQGQSANVLHDMAVQSTKDPQKQDPKSRFKARQARKAAAAAQPYTNVDAEVDAKLDREAKEEEKAITRLCHELDVKMYEINPDGHCLFSAVADQLLLLSILNPSEANYSVVRAAAADYIYQHPDDFLPFLPSAGEDVLVGTESGIMTSVQFENYCKSIRYTAVWGGEPEILALSRAYNVPIHVIQAGKPPIVMHNPTGTPLDGDIRDKRVVRISYHRRMYGLGEHYNSLRPNSKVTQITQAIHNVLS